MNRVPGLVAAAALSVASLGLLAAEEPATPERADDVRLQTRPILCAEQGGKPPIPIGAVLTAPGKEWLDPYAVRMSAIVDVPAGGYVFTASTRVFSGGLFRGGGDVMLAGVDRDLKPLWATVYGGPTSDTPSSVTRTSDGGYAVVAQTDGLYFSTVWRWTTAGPNAMLVSKYGADGTFQWARYHRPGNDVVLNAIVTLPNGNIAFGGSAWRRTRHAGFLIELDNQGTWVSGRELGSDYEDGIGWIETLPEGELALGGARRVEKSSRWDGWLARLGGDGKVRWAKSYAIPAGRPPAYMATTKTGGFVVVRWPSDAGAASFVPVFEVNADGDVLWARRYEIAGQARLSHVAQLPQGGSLLFGTANLASSASGPFVVEIAPSGDVASARLLELSTAMSSPERTAIVPPEPLSVTRDEAGYMVIGNVYETTPEIGARIRNGRATKDDMQATRSLLYLARFDKDGKTAGCSVPLDVAARPMDVRAVPFDLPVKELPDEYSGYVRPINLGLKRILPAQP